MSKKKKRQSEIPQDLIGINFYTTPEERDRYMQWLSDKGEIESRAPYQPMKAVKSCKFCNKGGLIWENKSGAWILVDPATNKRHICSPDDDDVPF